MLTRQIVLQPKHAGEGFAVGHFALQASLFQGLRGLRDDFQKLTRVKLTLT